MSKTALIKTELVPSPSVKSVESADATSLDTRRDRILHYHTSVIRAFGQQMGYAFLCGLELNAAREQIAHGAFEKWRAQSLPQLPERTARRYSAFADALQSECKAIARLTERAQLLLTNGDFEDSDRTELLQAVHAATDGKSLTQLYRDLGVIRDPIPQSKRDNSPKKSPEEREALRKEAALEWSRIVISRLEEYCADNDSAHQLHDDLPDAVIQELQDAIISASRINRDLLKARRATRAKVGRVAPRAPKKGKSK